ncbi:MAG: hypothetical protein DMG03_02545 [Acidobacteria bacterium]|nr:MAG: hypothetical protein DMG03_02545 [Acidobacteriota bacterium]
MAADGQRRFARVAAALSRAHGTLENIPRAGRGDDDARHRAEVRGRARRPARSRRARRTGTSERRFSAAGALRSGLPVPGRPGAGEVHAVTERLAIVVPCCNEAAVVDRFYDELAREVGPTGVDWSVCFVDDGSTDATLERLNALARAHANVRVYSLSRNFGHQIALSAGLDVTLGSAVDDRGVAARARRRLRRPAGHRRGELVQARDGRCVLPADQPARRDGDRSRRRRFLPAVGARPRGAVRDAGTAPVPSRHGVVDRIRPRVRPVPGAAPVRRRVEVHDDQDGRPRARRGVFVLRRADAARHAARHGALRAGSPVLRLHHHAVRDDERFRPRMGIAHLHADDHRRHPADVHRHHRRVPRAHL